MPQDAQGLAVTAASDAAASAFDNTVEGYLKYRADAGVRLKALLDLDAEMPMALVLKGAFAMLTYNAAMVPRAKEAPAAAARLAGTDRERAHAAALAFWAGGEMDRALAAWEGIMAAHPHDILAFRLHHFCAFWLGRAGQMLRAVDAVAPRWSAAIPGFGSILACRCFANEECGNYTVAEEAGRAAVALDPGDLWATHGVAHILEMQGRRGEGIVWLKALEQHWDGGSNLLHHLWWHRAMYHMERGEHAEVLALYDRGFRNHASALTQAMPDLYIDVQNAASMLFRLQRHGVDVGDRWIELADKAEARIGDCISTFTLPHWMMALAATGRTQAAARMLDAMREAATQPVTVAAILRDAAIPVCEAVLAHAQGDHVRAVEAMRPAVGVMHRMGGSHAQQDVLEQLFLDAAMKGGMQEDARMLLERVAGRHPVPPERRVGYAEAAGGIRH
ncbi:tetratricopeptide repeat protein [Neoroseomonas soli]|uniref:Tetratricopeptide repeat protein 38 n=1 Tax=Neoroseomonas soli TaxID=1081025 RepID=A0A9X9WVA3_9PROT|nr:tetratricopeptide repeat protein [Neoroseomonas soli]MBR0671082.1 tetratricopeptide repeat protein [Neoroseomonas soli]